MEAVSAKEEARQETLLCVNRLWEELNASIGFIQYRCGRRQRHACSCLPLLCLLAACRVPA